MVCGVVRCVTYLLSQTCQRPVTIPCWIVVSSNTAFGGVVLLDSALAVVFGRQLHCTAMRCCGMSHGTYAVCAHLWAFFSGLPVGLLRLTICERLSVMKVVEGEKWCCA